MSVLMFCALVGALAQQPVDPLRQTFLERVDQYVALHRQLEGPDPHSVVTDAEVLFARRQALGTAIRKARATAAQGDIFSPAIARQFRGLVADALKEGRVFNMLALVEEENRVRVPARVHGAYPAGRSIALMPPCLLAALPPLPPELAYQFVGRDLILWDVHAGLIVDIVPDAVPVPTGF